MSHFSDKDNLFMLRALELAELGRGKVSPNPMVGCVVVHNNQIVGEGWHRKFGEPHAEVNAINTVSDKGLLSEASVYVTLEPCSHYGKTPPCADLLVGSKVKKVVIACSDPNPLVSGKGVRKLQNAGIEVEIGLKEEEALQLNARFFTSITKKRPYVILKWAETKDRFVARSNFDSKWISNEYSRKLVHQWRAEEDAIMVGTNTARYDNPELNVRDWEGVDPVRIVIDKELVLDRELKLFNGEQPTLCYNLKESKTFENTSYIKLGEEFFLQQLLADLYHRKILSVIVEGGAQLLQSFIDNNLWDEARIFISKTTFEEGIDAPKIEGPCFSKQEIMSDELKIIKNEKS